MSNEPLKPMTVFIPTPISENPEKDGWYTLTDLKRNDMNRGHYFDGEEWDLYLLNDANKFFTHWLRPITEKEIREFAAKFFNAGYNFRNPGNSPDFETMFDQLLKDKK